MVKPAVCRQYLIVRLCPLPVDANLDMLLAKYLIFLETKCRLGPRNPVKNFLKIHHTQISTGYSPKREKVPIIGVGQAFQLYL